MDEDAVESSRGLDLDSMPPKQAVNTFLSRYAGRSITKGQDYQYETMQVNQSFVSILVVLISSCFQQSFTGQPCGTEKDAEVSAARAFLSDGEVRAAARNLPPPMWKIRHFIRDQNKEELQSSSNRKKTKLTEDVKQQTVERYEGLRRFDSS